MDELEDELDDEEEVDEALFEPEDEDSLLPEDVEDADEEDPEEPFEPFEDDDGVEELDADRLSVR